MDLPQLTFCGQQDRVHFRFHLYLVLLRPLATFLSEHSLGSQHRRPEFRWTVN
jgi:hypothetical protein